MAQVRRNTFSQLTAWHGVALTRGPAPPCDFRDPRLSCTHLPPPVTSFVRTETLQHIALFDKCRNFTRAREIQAAGLYPYFKPISHSEDTVVVIEGKARVMMGSNNYLGLTHHPEVLAAAKAALERYGSGCTGSRFLNGTLDLHEQLETQPAGVFNKEACLGLSTGYQAQLGGIFGPLRPSDVVFLRQPG